MCPAETVVVTPRPEVALVVDIAFGVVSKTLATMGVVARPLQAVGGPLVRVVLRPPLVPTQLQLGTLLGRAARRGAGYRDEVLVEVESVLVPSLVTELLHHVDLTELVQQNVDVVTLAEEVIAEIDLPAIIRDSTGAVASDTLLGVRMQSISGDEAVGRAMDRLRLRLSRRRATTRLPTTAPVRTT